MARVLVWDLPVRVFHWLLAASFLGAFGIAELTDDEGSLFSVHMLLGLVALGMVVLRLVWGFVGTRYARFRSLALSPGELVAYLGDALRGRGRRYVGHNPGASWAILAMFACILGLAVTGVGMSRGSEVAEELHEVLAFGMLATVVAHLAGVAFHVLRHRENVVVGMLDGRKEAAPADAIPSARPVVGLGFLAATGVWAGLLFTGFDGATGDLSLPGVGTVLTLGEGGEGGEEHGEEDEEWGEEDDD